ncbi:hypothetical protein ZEAMMB73_Zm00001d047301 [Zea mays]|uniref:Uncharacterized protein n=2 Tax=Zea mays TaxID=4577 RepID=A0A1D6P8I9_MAIZE|nr:hypothetical protein ZEAMMB73_Zm00001d047301 [Zea mays]AQL06122.1 hypothetical protein ZEAMMB73_Zm00001d047301 [Zea mays]
MGKKEADSSCRRLRWPLPIVRSHSSHSTGKIRSTPSHATQRPGQHASRWLIVSGDSGPLELLQPQSQLSRSSQPPLPLPHPPTTTMDPATVVVIEESYRSYYCMRGVRNSKQCTEDNRAKAKLQKRKGGHLTVERWSKVPISVA